MRKFFINEILTLTVIALLTFCILMSEGLFIAYSYRSEEYVTIFILYSAVALVPLIVAICASIPLFITLVNKIQFINSLKEKDPVLYNLYCADVKKVKYISMYLLVGSSYCFTCWQDIKCLQKEDIRKIRVYPSVCNNTVGFFLDIITDNESVTVYAAPSKRSAYKKAQKLADLLSVELLAIEPRFDLDKV